MYPKIVIDLNKLTENAKIISQKCHEHNVTMMAVSKSYCADPKVTAAFVAGGVDYIADSRLDNLALAKGINLPKVLLRLPSLSEVDKVVELTDISLNSELTTIAALDLAAKKLGKAHQIILMIDLGDLREGIWPSDFDSTVRQILTHQHIKLVGVGVNLTCYGGIIPKHDNLSQLAALAERLKSNYQLDIQIVSGGNSSSYYLLDKGQMPATINNLRMGESLVLGYETAYGKPIAGTHQDAFQLQAEIIEKKSKPSMPIGEIGRDAFGNIPSFEDKGQMVRAILSIGRQDVKVENLLPIDANIHILGASSDHLIVDITDVANRYQLGDIVTFNLEYGALLSLMTSPYVKREYK